MTGFYPDRTGALCRRRPTRHHPPADARLRGRVIRFARIEAVRQADPGASYPYPAQDDVLDGDDDPYD